MQVRLLGPTEVIGTSGALALGGPKQRSVLALLALSANRVVAVERLIAGVWGDDANERAAATLQVYISNLRRLLRDGDANSAARIDAQRPGYVLRVAPGEVDVVEFARLVDEARALTAKDDTAAGVRLLHEALDLWRGEALADLGDAPFCELERVRLEQARLAVTEERVEGDLGLGRHREIVTELEALVRAHPLRERLWGQLIIALYRADRQADALATYGRARDVLAEELGIDPGPALRELERAVLQQDLDLGVPRETVAAVSAPVRLPTPISQLIGRDEELARLHDHLTAGARLITLTGPGGSGKTRLLIALAHAAADGFAGTYFVDLTSVTDARDVLPTILRTLGGAEPDPQPPREAIPALIADRDVLVALDNVEQVLAAAGDIAELLRAAPRLRVIASSQTPLRIDGEVEHRVLGLVTPARGASVTDIAMTEAVRLFVARAQTARPTFTLDQHNGDVVAEICRRLDGLPLALELAAARLRLLSLDAIHARLDDSLGLLTSGHRDAPPRQRTLRAAITWSVDLLDPADRVTLGRLGVFAAGFDLAAALTVCDISDEAALETLIQNSLLQIQDDLAEPRLRLLDAVRQYACDVLLSAQEAAGATARLRAHFAHSAEAAAADLDGPRAGDTARRLDTDRANFRLALHSSLEDGDVETAALITVALAPWWIVLGRAGEALSDLRKVLAAGRSRAYDAALRAVAGRIAYLHNDLDLAGELLRAALDVGVDVIPLTAADAALVRCVLAAVASARGDPDAVPAAELALTEAEAGGYYAARVVARAVLAIAAARGGDFALEKELYEQRLAIARRQDDTVRVADTLTVLGEIAFDEHDYVSAAALVRESFALSDGYRGPESRDALIMLGRIAVADRDPERAAGLLDEALRRAVDVGQPAALALCLRVHGAAATLSGDPERAARLFGAGDALQPDSVPANPAVEQDVAARRTECRQVLGEVGFEREYRHGAQLDPVRAVVLASVQPTPRIAV